MVAENDGVQITSVTVGLPVRDLDAARRWYERVLELDPPHLAPVDGVYEYDLGAVWLQLFTPDADLPDPGIESGADEETVLRIGVPDVYAEHARLTELGVEVDPVVRVEQVIDFFDLRDLDGHPLSFYTVHPDAGS